MVEWFLKWSHLFWASLSAALVTLAGTWLLSLCLRRGEERRRDLRAFADAVLGCCDILDEIVACYWGSDSGKINGNKMKIMEKQIMAELEKIIGFTSTSSRLSENKKRVLRDILNRIYDKMREDFESSSRVADATKAGSILTEITSIRLEVNEMRAG